MHLLSKCSEWSVLSVVVMVATTSAYTPIVVKNITHVGTQLTPDVNHVSRDGGHSALINGNIVWLYDDTECMDAKGSQLSFVSNTAAYSASPRDNLTSVQDFGVINVGKEQDGTVKNAILAGTTVGKGGWVPFQPDELDFNQQMNGKERVAICKFVVISSSCCYTPVEICRAWNASNLDQHRSGLPLRTTCLRRYETTGPIERIFRPWHDFDHHHR